MSTPSPLDLTTLQAVKDWINANNTGFAPDSAIQRCITAWSINFLRLTGRGPRNWQNATQSPFNQPVAYTETYDGNGNNRLFLKNFPINSVSSLTAFGSALTPQSTPGGSGWAIDDQARSLVLIQNSIGGTGFSLFAGGPGFPVAPGRGGFPLGTQNIGVSYVAGFSTISVTGALYTVAEAWEASTNYSTGDLVSDGVYLQRAISSGESGTAAPSWANQANGNTVDGSGASQFTWINTGVLAQPNTVQVSSDVAILADNGVSLFSGGTQLTKVNTSPSAGQYFLVAPGLYLFNSAQAGAQVLISYTAAGTPTDIVQAAVEAVGLNYQRKQWIGISSESMKDVGQTTYTQFSMSKSVLDVVRNYTRTSLSG